MRANTLLLKLICLIAAGALMAACQSQATTDVGTAAQGAASGRTTAGTAAQGAARPTALPTRAVTANSTVAVDGALALSTPLVSASFDSSGIVTAMHVVPGQKVKKGDVLAELDGAELAVALQKAQESLTLKQAQIESSLAPAQKAEIDSAKAALSAAYAAYNEVKSGSKTHDIEQALRSWNQAKNSLYSTQINRDQTCAKKEANCTQAELSVKSSEMRERTAYQQYLDAQKPATQDDLTRAWASVVQAQSSLANLQNGATEAEKQVYDLQLNQAKVAVERAERDLAKAILVSPCDCVVQEVNLSVGGSASGSITLLDTAQVKFRAANVTERDVIKLQAGLSVSIRLKAYSQVFSGKLDAILPVSSGTQGSTALYTAIIDLDPAEVALLPGMTGQAEISLK